MSLSQLNNAAAVAYGQASGQRAAAFTSTAQLLGMSGEELSQALRSGANLSSLAGARGVSAEDLRASVQADLRAHSPRTMTSEAQLIVTASRLIDGGRTAAAGTASEQPSGMSDGEMIAIASRLAADAHGQPAAATAAQPGVPALRAVSSTTALSNLAQLASAAGVDPSEVLQRISSGQDVTGLLRQRDAPGYGSSLAGTYSGGIVIDEYA